MPYGPSSAIGNRRSHSPGMSRRARLLQRCVIRPWLWQCKYPPSMCVRALPAGVMFDPRVLFAVVDGRAPGTPGDYGVGHLLPAHFVVGLARLVCRDVLTFWPEEPKARAGGVGRPGDPPEAVVGSLGEHCSAKRAHFRDRGVDVVALPGYRPGRRFSGRQRLYLVADTGDWPVVLRVHVAGVVMTVGFLLEWIPAEYLAVEGDLCVVVVDIDGDEARGAVLVDHGEARETAGLPDASYRSRRVGDHRLTAEVIDRHGREMHRGTVRSGELEGALDVLRREEGLPCVIGTRLARVAHRPGDRHAGAGEHEVAAVIDARFLCPPAEQLGIELPAPFDIRSPQVNPAGSPDGGGVPVRHRCSLNRSSCLLPRRESSQDLIAWSRSPLQRPIHLGFGLDEGNVAAELLRAGCRGAGGWPVRHPFLGGARTARSSVAWTVPEHVPSRRSRLEQLLSRWASHEEERCHTSRSSPVSPSRRARPMSMSPRSRPCLNKQKRSLALSCTPSTALKTIRTCSGPPRFTPTTLPS